MVRVTGPVVLELQYLFAADWFLETNEVLDSAKEFPGPQIAGGVPAQALPSGPAFPTQNNQRLIVALVHGARQQVVLTTPYGRCLAPGDANGRAPRGGRSPGCVRERG